MVLFSLIYPPKSFLFDRINGHPADDWKTEHESWLSKWDHKCGWNDRFQLKTCLNLSIVVDTVNLVRKDGFAAMEHSFVLEFSTDVFNHWTAPVYVFDQSASCTCVNNAITVYLHTHNPSFGSSRHLFQCIFNVHQNVFDLANWLHKDF